MLCFEYQNLDCVIKNIVNDILFLNPTTECMDNVNGLNGYIHDVFIKTDSIDCRIDISDYLYTMSKWKQLLKLYVDKEKLKEFINILNSSKSYSQTFYFNQKPRTVGSGNGSCLISMVAVRPKRKEKFTTLVFSYRITVLTKQFVCDLVLFNRLAKLLNEICECCNIKEIKIFTPVASINHFHLALYYKNFNVKLKEHKEDYFCKNAIKWRREYFSGKKKTKYKSFERLIRYSIGDKGPSIPIESLKIL